MCLFHLFIIFPGAWLCHRPRQGVSVLLSWGSFSTRATPNYSESWCRGHGMPQRWTLTGRGVLALPDERTFSTTTWGLWQLCSRHLESRTRHKGKRTPCILCEQGDWHGRCRQDARGLVDQIRLWPSEWGQGGCRRIVRTEIPSRTFLIEAPDGSAGHIGVHHRESPKFAGKRFLELSWNMLKLSS